MQFSSLFATILAASVAVSAIPVPQNDSTDVCTGTAVNNGNQNQNNNNNQNQNQNNNNNNNNNNQNQNQNQNNNNNQNQNQNNNNNQNQNQNNNNNQGNTNNDAVDNATGAADFGTCDPSIEFSLGRPGRKADQGTFLPVDPAILNGQSDALNPSIIMNRVCDQLNSRTCNANQAAIDQCLAAKAQTEAAGTKDATTADLFNGLVQ